MARAPIGKHGRDHRPPGTYGPDDPGGHDPIQISNVYTGAGAFVPVVHSIPALRAYWRLGEAAGDWLDTSAFQSPAADLHAIGSGTALSRDVSAVIAAPDADGAVQWNEAAPSSSYTLVPDSIPGAAVVAGASAAFTIAAWVNVTASTLAWRGQVIGKLSVVAGSPSYESGYGIEIQWAGGATPPNARFVRANQAGGSLASSVAITAGARHFLAASYDGAYRRLYVDGTKVAEDADSRAITLDGVGLGGMNYVVSGSPVNGGFYGVEDEAMFFGAVLTDAQIAALYTAGAAGVTSSGKVLTADGSGSSTFSYPTIAVYKDGV